MVRFASFLFVGFTTMIVINPSERKLAKRTSVQRPPMASYSWCVKKHRKLLPEKPRGAGVMQCFFSGHLKFEGLEVSERHVSPLINTSGRVLQILRAT